VELPTKLLLGAGTTVYGTDARSPWVDSPGGRRFEFMEQLEDPA